MPNGRVTFTGGTIADRVALLAREIGDAYPDPTNLMVLAIAHGGVPFALELLSHPALHMADLQQLGVQTYGDSQTPEMPPVVKWRSFDWGDLAGRDVLVVDDIIDTGATWDHVVNCLHDMDPGASPSSIRGAVLLEKTLPRGAKEHRPDWVGFKVAWEPFYVGFGMDYQGGMRGARFIATLDEQGGDDVD